MVKRCVPLLALAALASAGDHCHREEQPKDRCSSKHRPKASRCQGCPPMYKGRPCASTTRYNDQTRGACGCGKSDPVPKDWWTLMKYTMAMDCKNLDPAHPHLAWCPQNCGSCYRLCTTGGSMHGQCPDAEVCRVFKVTNRCGDGWNEYPMWCSNYLSYEECKAEPHVCKRRRVPHNVTDHTNHYGYPAHFDLMDFHLQISKGLGWDNVEVTFEPVPCSEWQGPAWDCHCGSAEGGSTSDDAAGNSSSDGGGGEEEELSAELEAESHSEQGKPGKCGKEWAQCGGKNFKGPGCCEGCYCKHLGENGNEHYSHQCIPSHWKGCAYSAEQGLSSKFDAAPFLDIGSPRAILPAAAAAALLLTAGVLACWRSKRRRRGGASLLRADCE